METTHILNAELAELIMWLSANVYSLFNYSKSHFMIFHCSRLYFSSVVAIYMFVSCDMIQIINKLPCLADLHLLTFVHKNYVNPFIHKNYVDKLLLSINVYCSV